MNPLKNKTGFTLFELIVAVSVLGLIMVSFQQVLKQSLSAHKDTREKLEQVSQARFAMDRIARLITETGFIETPASGGSAQTLVIEERSMDFIQNSTHNFVQDGDGILDADDDSNGVVNDTIGLDEVNKIFISLDKTDPDNWKLVERLPNYLTVSPIDTMPPRTLCENVTAFLVTRGSSDQSKLIKIDLELGGDKNQISLTTRAIAGKLLIL